jgi:hypothetical protein
MSDGYSMGLCYYYEILFIMVFASTSIRYDKINTLIHIPTTKYPYKSRVTLHVESMYVYRYLTQPKKHVYLYGLTKHGCYQMHEIPTFTCFGFTQPQMVIKHLFLSFFFQFGTTSPFTLLSWSLFVCNSIRYHLCKRVFASKDTAF